MAGKYKISIRKIVQVFFTLVVSVCCLIAMISASDIESNKPLSDVQVQIISGKKYHFVEEQQILKEAITSRNIDVKTTPVSKLDIKAMEQVIERDPWVSQAQLYVDNNRVLHMVVTQRMPIARLFQQDGTSCYMDNTLATMPLTPNFNFYASVVTNVPVLTSDSVSWMTKKQIAHMLRFIQADTFWNAQVSHMAIDSGFTFELYPVLGDQVIVFGDTSRTREKFSNMYAFYKKVLNRIGWDMYDKFDLRYKGQVIASPSLPYKGPVDKANATMNWLTAFVETEVRKDSMTAIAENRGVNTDAGDHKEEAKKPETAKSAVAADHKAGDKKVELTPVKGRPVVLSAVDKKAEPSKTASRPADKKAEPAKGKPSATADHKPTGKKEEPAKAASKPTDKKTEATRGKPAVAADHKPSDKKAEPAKAKPAASEHKPGDKKAEPAKVVSKPAAHKQGDKVAVNAKGNAPEHKNVPDHSEDKKRDDSKKHEDGKKADKPTDKQAKDKQPKAVIKLSDLGNEKKR